MPFIPLLDMDINCYNRKIFFFNTEPEYYLLAFTWPTACKTAATLWPSRVVRRSPVIRENRMLYSREETPQWLREPFIKSGYSQAYSAAWQCLQSLFYLHNQSVNIWSHLLTSLYFLVPFGVALSGSNSLSDPLYLPLIAAVVGTIFMYSTSATAHLFDCIAGKTYKTGFYLDHATISVYTFPQVKRYSSTLDR